METIVMQGENGDQIELEVLETTRLGGVDYYLVCDTSEEDEEYVVTYIMKDVSKVDEETSVYEFVEEEKEYDAIAAIFEEIVSDAEFEK